MAGVEGTTGLEFIEPIDLYNMLQQGTNYSCLSDTNYLYLIDARKKIEYNESHIVTAKMAPRNEDEKFLVPYDAEIECKKNIVVYDSNTCEMMGISPAIDCAILFWKVGSRGNIKVLSGGYEEFSALYPFLRTQKIFYTPRELDEIKTYPVEICPGLLYLGNWRQGNSPQVQKDLKIRGHINCCVEAETFFHEPGPHLLHIQVNDENEEDLYSHFKAACAFTDYHFEELFAVLVFGKIGISRAATVVIAIIMYTNRWTLNEAYKHVKTCCRALRPNRGFIEQLSKWEQEIFGRKRTNIADPNF